MAGLYDATQAAGTSQTQSQTQRKTINQQLQSKFAGTNGMAQASGASSSATQPLGSTSSAVTPTGQINQQNAPSPGANFVQTAQGGWVPKDHPLAQQQAAPQTVVQGQPQPAYASPYGPYPGRPPDTQFDPLQLSFSELPDQSQLSNLQMQALQKVLSSGSQLPVGAMKESLKEQALSMGGQRDQQLRESAAARGSLEGGALQAALGRSGAETQSDILKGYRDLDINAALHDQDMQLKAIDGASNALESQMRRALGAGEMGLKEALAQHGINFDAYNANHQNYSTDLDAWFRNRGLDISEALGLGGLDVDRARLSSSDRQFDLAHALAVMQFLENQRQFNRGLGFDYGNANLNALRGWV